MGGSIKTGMVPEFIENGSTNKTNLTKKVLADGRTQSVGEKIKCPRGRGGVNRCGLGKGAVGGSHILIPSKLEACFLWEKVEDRCQIV